MRWKSPSASTSSAASRTSTPRAYSAVPHRNIQEGADLIDMIKENLVAERIAVDHYRELIRYFGNDDPGTKSMLQGILRVEEEHADDLH